MNGKLLRVDEVARLLDLREHRIYELARMNILPHVRLGRQLRFSAEKIQQFIESGGQALPGPGGWRKEA